MTSIDSRTFLTSGGYLQKGGEVNIRENDIEKKVQDLLPGRLGAPHNGQQAIVDNRSF